MNVLIDTNVILDDILNRVPNAETAKRINQLVTDEIIRGYLTANTLTDIFYIIAKNRSETVAKKAIKNLLLLYSVISVDGDDCQKAIDLPVDDFEDALVAVCAERENADYIVTRDVEFSQMNTHVKVISPSEFANMYG